jgi:hypothetical protein
MMALRLPPACHQNLGLNKVYPKIQDRVRDVILLEVESFEVESFNN